MELLSRRSVLRLAGAGAGASGLVAVGLAAASGVTPLVHVTLESTDVRTGDLLTLRVSVLSRQVRGIRILDSVGFGWMQVSDAPWRKVWTATAVTPGAATVSVVYGGHDGGEHVESVDFQVTDTEVASHDGGPLIGMSAMSSEWDQKVAEVGAGLGARRIFADLASGPTTQIGLVEDAHAAGMLPVISYKVGGDVEGAIFGAYDAVAEQAAAKLASYGLPTAVAFWHEPYGDMTGEQYAAASRQILPAFKRGELRVGPILNGWLLDNQQAAFSAFCPDDLFGLWDWFGIDTYESGSMQAPGVRKPADRIPAASAYMASRGYDLPLGVGEYNGFSGETITAVGEALLSTSKVWFGCLWNVTGGLGHELSGERLTAFQNTVADPRAGSIPRDRG